jgi:protein-L-isoaspartate(D-aspartate) O-methyltransferase
MNIEQARFNMIEQQIRPWEVLDAQVLQQLSRVRREDFVPEAHRAIAFADLEVPLPCGQCMLAPKVEARLLQELALAGGERVLEVGAGSGHMAALLAGFAQSVLSLEIEPELVAMAQANLKRAGLHHVQVRMADGASGAPSDAPFDVIVLSGSVADVPATLLNQLKVGGRLAAIVGQEPVMRATFITRTAEASFATAQPWDTVAPRLRNFSEPSRFSF